MAPASRASVVRLLSLTANGGCRGCGRTHGAAHHPHPPSPALSSHHHHPLGMGMGMRGLATPIDVGGYNPPPGNTDYAFEVHPYLAVDS
jgi:hydroxyacid-oxoacid transhydrogenase